MDNKIFINASEITCPECGEKEWLSMTLDSCLWSHTCPGCHKVLKPLKERGCLFCSYGSFPCPEVQLKEGHFSL